MFGTYEFLYLLFSMSEMMLTVSVKPFIVNVIQKQELRIGFVFEDRPQLISNETMAGSEVTEGTVTLNSTGIQNSEPQDKHILDSRKKSGRMPTAGQSAEGSEVEAKAGIYLMIDLVGSYLPWMIVGTVCGVWSDRHGRKPPLLISLVGHVISVVFYMLAQLHPEHLLATVILGSASRGLAGKHSMFTMVIYSMTSDTSCESQRSSRFASLTASRYIGLCLGSLSAGLLADSIGVLYSMLASSALQTLSLWSSQREVIVQSVTVPPLDWPSSWYGYLSAMYFGATGLALLILVPCMTRLLPPTVDPDVIVLVIALVCGAACGVWTGLAIYAVSSWQIFGSYVIGALGPASNSPLRSMLSRCVGDESQGKVLAVQSVLESLAKVLGPVLHTAVYVSSLAVSPSLVYYVMAGETVLLLPAVAWISRNSRQLPIQL
ncbi:hypothetical protein BaRGS_00018868 [Batillaria attramentaria]|uniref:Proton-coupled folate transporter n=1 Tax=Batillaria attramentaria TaxID=370345 RepID=A0ABD0KS68_9CAEN